jgi:hypothetical protein
MRVALEDWLVPTEVLHRKVIIYSVDKSLSEAKRQEKSETQEL